MPTSFYVFASVFLVGFLDVRLLGHWVSVYVIYPDIAPIPLPGYCSIVISYSKVWESMFSHNLIVEHIVKYLEFCPYI